MARFTRPVLYSLVLISVLAAATILLRRSPSNIDARVRRALGTLLAEGARLEIAGGRLGAGGAVELDRAEVSVVPRGGPGARLELRGVHAVEDPLSAHDIPPGLLEARAASGPRGGPWWRLRIDAARLDLGGSRPLEGIEALLREPAPDPGAAAPGFLGSVRGLEVAIGALSGATTPLVLAGSDVVLAGRLDGTAVALAGACAPRGAGESAGDGLTPAGRVRVVYSPGTGLASLEGTFRNLASLEPFHRLVPGLVRFEEAFRPQGRVDLELSLSRGNGGGAESPAALRATVRHHESALSVPGEDLRLEHVSGPVRVESGSISFGEPAGGAPDLRGTFAGAEARLGARIDDEGSTVELVLPEFELGAIDRLPRTGWLGAAVRALALRGRAAVELSRRSGGAAGTTGTESLELRTARAVPAACPLVEEIAGAIVVSGDPAGSGEATITMAPVRLRGLGEVTGSALVTFDPGAITVNVAADTRVGEDGEIDGRLTIDRASGSVGGRLTADRWRVVLPGLLEGEIERLELSFPAAGESSRVGPWSGELSAALGAATVELGEGGVPAETTEKAAKADTLPPKAAFASGKATATLSAAGLRIETLRLSTHGGALLFRGEVSWDGVVDGVGSVASGAAAARLEGIEASALRGLGAAAARRPIEGDDAGAPPAADAAATAAVPGHPFVLTGTLARPRLRWLPAAPEAERSPSEQSGQTGEADPGRSPPPSRTF